MLLDVKGLASGYGGSTVLTGVDLTVHEGEAVTLLGRNSMAKTTLLKAIAGTLQRPAGP